MKAAGDSGSRRASCLLDRPAGQHRQLPATRALGTSRRRHSSPTPTASKTCGLRRGFQGQDRPVSLERPGPHGARHVGSRRGSEGARRPSPATSSTSRQLAFAMEKVTVDSSTGSDQDAARGPSGAAAARRRHRVQGRQVQGRQHRQGLQDHQAVCRASEAAGPVQPSCKMERPAGLTRPIANARCRCTARPDWRSPRPRADARA